MSDVPKLKISPEHLTMLKAQHAKRFQLEAELGVLTFQYHQAIRDYESKRERSIREQSAIGTHALKELGLDTDLNEYRIDLETGEVIQS